MSDSSSHSLNSDDDSHQSLALSKPNEVSQSIVVGGISTTYEIAQNNCREGKSIEFPDSSVTIQPYGGDRYAGFSYLAVYASHRSDVDSIIELETEKNGFEIEFQDPFDLRKIWTWLFPIKISYAVILVSHPFQQLVPLPLSYRWTFGMFAGRKERMVFAGFVVHEPEALLNCARGTCRECEFVVTETFKKHLNYYRGEICFVNCIWDTE